jgi:membrane-anchored protein YejM (alkaline phosphatase superfamily)
MYFLICHLNDEKLLILLDVNTFNGIENLMTNPPHKLSSMHYMVMIYFVYLGFCYIIKFGDFNNIKDNMAYMVGVVSYFSLVATLYILMTLAIRQLFKQSRLIDSILIITTMLLILFTYLDFKIYSLSGLHVNSFLLEFLSQPNAMKQAGVSARYVFVASYPLVIIFVVALFIKKFSGKTPFSISLTKVVGVLTFFSFSTYGIYSIQMFSGGQSGWVMKRSLPYFLTPSNYSIRRAVNLILPNATMENVSKSHYQDKSHAPTQNIPTPQVITPYNIVIVVAESFRATDMELSPEVTPNLYRWNDSGTLFVNNYSASNCTHFSIFSILTGKSPIHYNDFRINQKQPLTMRILDEAGYTVTTSESISLDWYDLANFIFNDNVQRNIMGGKLEIIKKANEEGLNESIYADIAVTNHAIYSAIKHKELAKPYFNLVYYNSTHFDYNYMENDPTFTPSLKGSIDLSNITTQNEKLELVNRFKNSLHFVDSEFGRLMDNLHQLGTLDNTIVVFTGDHGEELFENGVIGHNTKINKFQTQVPLFIHLPAKLPKLVSNNIQSHLNIMPTIFNIISPSFPADYFMGSDISTETSGQVFISNCGPGFPDGFALLNNDQKVTFEYLDGYLELEPNQSVPLAHKNRMLQQLISILNSDK